MTNTTNTTKKTNGKIKRTLTAALAAIMMMSTAATIAASADNTQAVVNMNTSTAVTKAANSGSVFTLDDDLLKVKDVSVSTIFKVIESNTEYGKFFTPALGAVVDLVFGGQPNPTQQKLDEINGKIDKLFDRIDKLQSELANSFGNQLGIQSFYDSFVDFKSQVLTMRRKINEISTDKSLTMLDKIAKIGSLAGSYNEWNFNFENVFSKLNELISKPSFTQDGNIFELTYNHFCGESMFSGEALDKAKPLCDLLMQVYIAGVTTITECLSAQYYVSQLPDEYKNRIDSEYSSHICKNANDITTEIETLTENIVKTKQITIPQKELTGFIGSDNKTYPKDCGYWSENTFTGVNYYIGFFNAIKLTPIYSYTFASKTELADCTYKEMYDNVFGRSRRILVNKNSSGNGYQVSEYLDFCNHSDNPYNTGKYSSNKATVSVEWFNGKAGNNQISFNDIKAIGNYCRSKGISIRTLLNSVGINTSAVPANANIVTSKGIDDTDPTIKGTTGVFYSNGYYMGINIDKVGAGEEKIKFIDDGKNIWKGEEWAWAPAGSFCWLTR